MGKALPEKWLLKDMLKGMEGAHQINKSNKIQVERATWAMLWSLRHVQESAIFCVWLGYKVHLGWVTGNAG